MPVVDLGKVVGPQGAQGVPGPQGAQGVQGEKGDKGDTGPQGPQGAVGPRGAQGVQGEKGEKGDTGPQGLQGPKGDKGDKGDTGATGAKGATGAMGPTGPAGPKGATGATGPKGEKGDTGARGATGAAGKSAYQQAVAAGYAGTEAEFTAALAAIKNMLPLSGGTMTGTLSLLSGGTAKAALSATGASRSNPVLYCVEGVDGYGGAVILQGGGMTIIGGGEAGTAIFNALGLAPGAERTDIASDGAIYFHSGCQNVNNRKTMAYNTDGTLSLPAAPTAPAHAVQKSYADKVAVNSIRGVNLLHNAHFFSPINQINGTTYTGGISGGVYTIDRWKANYIIKTVTVNSSGYMTISGSATGAEWMQYIEETFPVGTVMTLSALIRSSSNTVGIRAKIGEYYSSVAKSSGTNDWELVSVTFTSDGNSYRQAGIYFTNGAASCDVQAMKLEMGSVQTLAHKDSSGKWVLNDPPPDKAAELAKCQRHCFNLLSKANNGESYLFTISATTSTRGYGILHTPVTFRARPVLITDCSTETGYNAFGFFTNGCEYVEAGITKIWVHAMMNHGLIVGADVTGGTFVRGNRYLITINPTSKHKFILDANL